MASQPKQCIVPSGVDLAGTPPYSPGLSIGDWVFVSGQGPLAGNPRRIVGQTIEEQTRQTLENVRQILQAAGCDMNDCVKVTVHLSDMANFDRMNAVYRTFFNPPYPTRTTVQSGLWGGMLIEIDVVALRGCGSTKG